MTTYHIGDRVTLTGAPKNLLAYRGQGGVVTATALAKSCQFVTVELTVQAVGNLPMILRDVPSGYLSAPVPAPLKRRSPLNRHGAVLPKTKETKL